MLRISFILAKKGRKGQKIVRISFRRPYRIYFVHKLPLVALVRILKVRIHTQH